MGIVIFWIFWVVVGGMIGNAKGRLGSGLIWSFLLGPLGVIIVLCLTNLKKEKELLEQKQLVVKQMQIQQAQLETQLQQLNQLKVPATKPNLLSDTYLIAKDGEELGEMTVSKVKLLLKSGHLTKLDYFFDPQVNDWLMLEQMEEL
jgi:hypothetical protein